MTVPKLITKYYEHNPDGHFFDGETLSFFGELADEMRLADRTEVIEDYLGNQHECYVLVTYQHNTPSFCPDFSYHYFDVKSFEHIVAEV